MANYKLLTATSQVKASAGRLCSITVSSTSSGTITIYDEAQGGTTAVVLATLTPAAGFHAYFGEDGLSLNSGLYVVIANTMSVTIGYK